MLQMDRDEYGWVWLMDTVLIEADDHPTSEKVQRKVPYGRAKAVVHFVYKLTDSQGRPSYQFAAST